MPEQLEIEQDFQEAPPQGNPIDKLYKTLVNKGYYTKSFDEFKTKYSTPESIEKLYSVVNRDGLYTKSKDEFQSQYFTPIEKKNLGGTPSSVGGSPFPSLSETLSSSNGKKKYDANKWVKTPPVSISEGIQKDKKKNNSVLGGVYNMLVGSVSRLAGGIAETAQILGENLTPFKQAPLLPEGLMRQKTSEFIDKARTAKSSRENEQARSQFDITDGLQASDVSAIAFVAPSTITDMVAGAFTYGTSFFFQSVADNAKELDESPSADKLNSDEKLVYLFLQGTVQAALEKYSIDKILKSTGLSSKVKQKIANEITEEFVKKGVKATAKDIENAALRKVSTLAMKAKKVGVKSTTSMVVEGTTETGQQMASDGIKLLTNKITDKKVFDEEDIKVNFIKNALNAGAQGGVFGKVVGGASGVLSNTNKAIRNELSKAQTPEDVQKIQTDIAEQVELGNITEEEAQAANITAQQYAEIAARIPQEVDAEKKYAIIGGIEQRENLKKEIQKSTEELSGIDPAFHAEKTPQIELLQAKLEQTNDYIDGLVADKKVTYKKEGKEGEEKYIKTMPDGKEVDITKEHYELGVAVREEEANKKKQAKTSQPDDQYKERIDALNDREDLTPEQKEIEKEKIMQEHGEFLKEETIPPTEGAGSSGVGGDEKVRTDNADLMRDVLDEFSIDKDGGSLLLEEKDNIHKAINDYESGKISGEELGKAFIKNGVDENYLSKKMEENGMARSLELPPQKQAAEQSLKAEDKAPVTKQEGKSDVVVDKASNVGGDVVKRLVEPDKPIREMNSEELYDFAVKTRRALKEQDKEFANKTEEEKVGAGYYDFIDDVEDLRDASERINFIENAENIDDLAASAKSGLSGMSKDNPSEYSLSVMNAVSKKTIELNISPEDLIKAVIKKVGNQYKDASDAEDMMRTYLEKIVNEQKTGLDFIEKNFKSIVAELVLKNKIKRICK